MLYAQQDREALRAWLVKALEPVCDAEPDALATYVLALLEHKAPEQELRREIASQLEEFIEDGAADFVISLFAALRSKSYIPYTTAPARTSPRSTVKSADDGIRIPLDGFMGQSSTSPGRGHKRSAEDDERELRGPPKGPRLGGDGPYSRYPHANGHGAEGGDGAYANGHPGRGGARSRFPVGADGRLQLPRGVCRDYHIKGYCSRGAMCKYSHDDAAIAPGQLPFPSNMGSPMPVPGPSIPFMPMFAGGPMPFPMNPASGAPYDPNEAHLDMRPNQGSMLGGRPPDGPGRLYDSRSETAVQDLTPQQQPQPMIASTSTHQANGYGNAHGDSQQQQQPHPTTLGNGAVNTPVGQIAPPSGVRPPRGGNSHFRGGRGGKGTFTGDHQSFRSDSIRDNKTLVVEKLPEEHLTLEAVNGWFKRFGTVTNVAVDPAGGKALVSFSSHDEAETAWTAEEAVFNNRFVKIFWHRPMEGQGAAGARALQASAPLVANIAGKEAKPASTPSVPVQVAPARPAAATTAPAASITKTSTSSNLTALAAKQQALEKKIAEQKELMGRLGTALAEEKREIMARLRKLDEESTPAAPVPPASSTSAPLRSTSAGPSDKERRAKELLDMELDVHAAKTIDGPASTKEGEGEESSKSLQEKLAKLRAEAEALGISDTNTEPAYAPYRGYRGRGRGRGRPTYRGIARGGQPRASMKLDNRPRALVVSGINSGDANVVQAVRDYYEPGGQFVSLNVQDGSSVVVHFRNRNAAEIALAKGTAISGAGTAKLSWLATSTPGQGTPATALPSDTQKRGVGDDRPPSPRPEDTPEDAGWGDGEEDGMGMF